MEIPTGAVFNKIGEILKKSKNDFLSNPFGASLNYVTDCAHTNFHGQRVAVAGETWRHARRAERPPHTYADIRLQRIPIHLTSDTCECGPGRASAPGSAIMQ